MPRLFSHSSRGGEKIWETVPRAWETLQCAVSGRVRLESLAGVFRCCQSVSRPQTQQPETPDPDLPVISKTRASRRTYFLYRCCFVPKGHIACSVLCGIFYCKCCLISTATKESCFEVRGELQERHLKFCVVYFCVGEKIWNEKMLWYIPNWKFL